MIESWDAIWSGRYGWYEAEGLGYDAETRDWLRSAAGADTPLDGALADGEVIDLGGVAVEVLALPGHSAGHLGFLERRSGCAIVVDAVLERGLYDVAGTRISPPPASRASRPPTTPTWRGTRSAASCGPAPRSSTTSTT
jgi:glyoxylase-like metal-dependent hydrolase (beta-lactamase superfamily II)